MTAAVFFFHGWTQKDFFSSIKTFVVFDIFRNQPWRRTMQFYCVCYVCEGKTDWTFKYRQTLDVTLHQVKIREHISRTDCALTEEVGLAGWR